MRDKTVSTLTGRPLLLGRRYSTCQLPLDLSDEQLMAEEPELSRIRDQLDNNGWNTSGEVYASIWARALLLINLIREEVLEISLGISNDCSELLPEYSYSEPKQARIQHHINDLERRCEEVYACLPQSVRYSIGKDLSSPQVFPRKVAFHLLFLHCLFLLERLSISRIKSSGQRLVDLAIQMMDDVLILWARRDWLVDFQWFYRKCLFSQP